MLAATHAIAGGIIASKASTPLIGYAIAILSHPLLDLFPHWDLHTRHSKKSKFTIIWTSLFDAGIGLTIGYLLFMNKVDFMVLITTMLLSQIFDWLESPIHVFGWNFPPFSTIKKMQSFWHTKMEWPWGFIPQVLILILAIVISFK